MSDPAIYASCIVPECENEGAERHGTTIHRPQGSAAGDDSSSDDRCGTGGSPPWLVSR